eukprot:TRINITY_DN19545_c0_g1_i2.p1 TRINITY_DN19545_c0_g1~~TRINITY_DN19545_c0_g1_i2.p1  ORF type:complete len:368 (+),score=57.13 TRINITY_DN19545_c0_g1_i2:214-1317(+)
MAAANTAVPWLNGCYCRSNCCEPDENGNAVPGVGPDTLSSSDYAHAEQTPSFKKMEDFDFCQLKPIADVLEERPEQVIEGGSRYLGQWTGDTIQGQGVLSRPDGSVYTGRFQNGKAHGLGQFRTANGDVYDGNWTRDQAHGCGKYTHADGSYYEGEWSRDEKCGHGVEVYTDGSRYEGLFERGRKHGEGMYISKAGVRIFVGQMHDNRMHGAGQFIFSDGRAYDGQWVLGKMQGEGSMKWPDGKVYTGSMRSDLRHGQGRLKWPDSKTCYYGQWVSGKQEGLGSTRDAAGRCSYGKWEAGNFLEELEKPADLNFEAAWLWPLCGLSPGEHNEQDCLRPYLVTTEDQDAKVALGGVYDVNPRESFEGS